MSDVRMPVSGEIVYIYTSLYLGHGRDDVRGGKATVIEVIERDTSNDYNRVFVQLHGISGEYNWQYLLENQEKWAEEYGDQWAYPDPDYRSEFNVV